LSDIKRILWATDFSEPSRWVIPYLELFSQKLGVEVFVININKGLPRHYLDIWDNRTSYINIEERTRQEKIRKLDILIDELETKGIKLKAELRDSEDIAGSIIEFAKEKEIGIIFTGSKGHSLLDSLFVGSTSLRLVRNSEIPLFIVKKEEKNPKIEKVLFPTDLSETSYSSIDLAIDIAEGFDAELHLLHIIDIYSASPETTEAFLHPEEDSLLEDKLKDKMPSIPSNISIKKHILRGFDIAKEINDFVFRNNIDLIVMSTHGRSGITKAILGSVTEKVVQTSFVPVLVKRSTQ